MNQIIGTVVLYSKEICEIGLTVTRLFLVGDCLVVRAEGMKPDRPKTPVTFPHVMEYRLYDHTVGLSYKGLFKVMDWYSDRAPDLVVYHAIKLPTPAP